MITNFARKEVMKVPETKDSRRYAPGPYDEKMSQAERDILEVDGLNIAVRFKVDRIAMLRDRINRLYKLILVSEVGDTLIQTNTDKMVVLAYEFEPMLSAWSEAITETVKELEEYVAAVR